MLSVLLAEPWVGWFSFWVGGSHALEALESVDPGVQAFGDNKAFLSGIDFAIHELCAKVPMWIVRGGQCQLCYNAHFVQISGSAMFRREWLRRCVWDDNVGLAIGAAFVALPVDILTGS